jgi:hypothetical protein
MHFVYMSEMFVETSDDHDRFARQSVLDCARCGIVLVCPSLMFSSGKCMSRGWQRKIRNELIERCHAVVAERYLRRHPDVAADVAYAGECGRPVFETVADMLDFAGDKSDRARPNVTEPFLSSGVTEPVPRPAWVSDQPPPTPTFVPPKEDQH